VAGVNTCLKSTFVLHPCYGCTAKSSCLYIQKAVYSLPLKLNMTAIIAVDDRLPPTLVLLSGICMSLGGLGLSTTWDLFLNAILFLTRLSAR
jgi:hypothetical protein